MAEDNRGLDRAIAEERAPTFSDNSNNPAENRRAGLRKSFVRKAPMVNKKGKITMQEERNAAAKREQAKLPTATPEQKALVAAEDEAGIGQPLPVDYKPVAPPPGLGREVNLDAGEIAPPSQVQRGTLRDTDIQYASRPGSGVLGDSTRYTSPYGTATSSSLRKGGGNLSVMENMGGLSADAPRADRIAANVAAYDRQTAALRGLREAKQAQQAGPATDTYGFDPQQEALFTGYTGGGPGDSTVSRATALRNATVGEDTATGLKKQAELRRQFAQADQAQTGLRDDRTKRRGQDLIFKGAANRDATALEEAKLEASRAAPGDATTKPLTPKEARKLRRDTYNTFVNRAKMLYPDNPQKASEMVNRYGRDVGNYGLEGVNALGVLESGFDRMNEDYQDDTLWSTNDPLPSNTGSKRLEVAAKLVDAYKTGAKKVKIGKNTIPLDKFDSDFLQKLAEASGPGPDDNIYRAMLSDK